MLLTGRRGLIGFVRSRHVVLGVALNLLYVIALGTLSRIYLVIPSLSAASSLPLLVVLGLFPALAVPLIMVEASCLDSTSVRRLWWYEFAVLVLCIGLISISGLAIGAFGEFSATWYALRAALGYFGFSLLSCAAFGPRVGSLALVIFSGVSFLFGRHLVEAQSVSYPWAWNVPTAGMEYTSNLIAMALLTLGMVGFPILMPWLKAGGRRTGDRTG